MKIEAYTDGASKGNGSKNAKGGWGVYYRALNNGKEVKSKGIFGGKKGATNNQMELQACIECLKNLSKKTKITIYTDSQYVKNGITDWIVNWKNNNWRTSSNKDIKNVELWIELDKLNNKHIVEWKWVKGHSNNRFNDVADALATKGANNA